MKTISQLKKGLSVVTFSILSLFISLGASAQTAASFDLPNDHCSNRNLQFTNTSTLDSSDTLVSFKWYFEDAEIETYSTSTDEDGNAEWKVLGSKVITLKIYLKNGDSLAYSQSIDLNSGPLADFEVAPVCCGNQLQLINTSTVDSGDLSFEWDIEGVDSNGNVLCALPYHTIKLIASNAGGCSDSITKTFTPDPLPDATFTHRWDGRTIYFSGPPGNDTYRWTFGDGGKDVVESPTYTYEDVPNEGYTVCLATKKGICSDRSCQDEVGVIKIIGSIGDKNRLEFNIHPNPSKGKVILNVPLTEQYELHVSDILGNEVNFKQDGSTLDLSELADGIYFIRLLSEGVSATQKVVLSR